MSTWSQPPNTLEIRSEMIPPWVMDLLVNDCTNCVQIETPEGFLIKVQTEDQTQETIPHDLAELIEVAKASSMEWLLIKAPGKSPNHFYLN